MNVILYFYLVNLAILLRDIVTLKISFTNRFTLKKFFSTVNVKHANTKKTFTVTWN